ncbi:PAS domain S-box protein [Sphingomonas sp. S1-29]|uniref:PAS domain S-box protein n=1 Tax=Sphingomonas sp. S1-29 TaxID=2991074 RepID=UPI00223FEC3E|nr:PAS domain S-box protein [Sphingomonas sp. S1-29]UZK69774.1 PAS domain S-box protein [Sphingomonas sp. S1-29]
MRSALPWLRVAGVAVLFLALALAGVALTRGTGPVAALWLPNAFLVVALFSTDLRRGATLAACFVASLAANLLSGYAWPLATALAGCNIVEVVAIVWGMRRLAPGADLTELKPLLIFTVLAGAVVPAGVASLASAAFQFGGEAAGGAVWLTYAKAHALGQMVIVPILLILTRARIAPVRRTPRSVGEALAILGAVILVCFGVFTQDQLPLLFLVTPFVLLATFRLGAKGAAGAVIVVAIASGLATFLDTGPIALVDGVGARLTVLQLFVAASFMSALPVAAALGERERLAAALGDSEAQLASITDNMREVVFRADRQGRWSFLNPAWEELTGYTVAESIGRPVIELVPEPDAQKIRERWIDLLSGVRSELEIRTQLRRANGELRWVEATIRRQGDQKDGRRDSIGSIRDITDRHEQAMALAARERELRLVTTHSADMIVRTGVDRVRRYVSPRSLSLLGYHPEEITNQAPFHGIHPDDVADVEARCLEAIEASGPAHSVYRQRHRDGHYVWVEANYSVVRDEATGEALEFIASVRDFGARAQLEEELHGARIRAEDAARLKAAFLANMSHEIRTPMNGVIGFTELLLASDLDAEQRRYASLIRDSGRTMMALLNDILDLSKIDADQIEIADEPFDLLHTISSSVRMLTTDAEAKHLSIELALDGDLPKYVMGDSHRIRQILLNLLSNAIKFTDSGLIRVGGGRDGDMLEILVDDSGSGIPIDRQALIFDQFVQGDASIARRYGGTGLGLAISQRLARLMGGDLCLVRSDAAGTRMQLSLPMRIADPAAVPPPKISMMRPAKPSSGARILVAEDAEINQLLIEALLTRHGHAVRIVADGAQAIAAFGTDPQAYDLILMDMQMPVVDGVEATRRIRAMGDTGATVPIVAFTANAFASDAELCRAAGMNAHLSKPIDVDAVIATIARLLGDRAPAAAPPPPSPMVEDPAVTALRGRYEAAKRGYSAELLTLEGTLRSADDHHQREARATIAGICHKLSGSAGMFGEADLGAVARTLEEAAMADGDAAPLADHTRRLAEALVHAA